MNFAWNNFFLMIMIDFGDENLYMTKTIDIYRTIFGWLDF